MSQAPKGELDADVILPIDVEGVNGRAYRSTCLDAARLACPQLAAVCAAQWEPCETSIWQKCDDGCVASNTTRGGWQGSRAMQVTFVLGVEHALRKCDDRAPEGVTRIGLQDDKTTVGSVAGLNRAWPDMGKLAEALHQQFEDNQLPSEVRNVCQMVSRKRMGISQLGSSSNVQHAMEVCLGQPAQAPT